MGDVASSFLRSPAPLAAPSSTSYSPTSASPVIMSTPIPSHIVSEIPPIEKFQVYVNIDNGRNGYHSCVADSCNMIYLPHLSKYGVGIANLSDQSCDASLFVDNLFLGKFRISRKSDVVIERPLHTNRSLIFISQNSVISRSLELNNVVDKSKYGRLKVIIWPEKKRQYKVKTIKKSVVSNFHNRDKAHGSLSGLSLGLPVETDWCGNDNIDSSITMGTAPPSDEDNITSSVSTVTATTMTPDEDNIDTSVSTITGAHNGTKLGVTILGKQVSQKFVTAPCIKTGGSHTFIYDMMVGDPSRNIMYMNNLEKDYVLL